MPALKMKRGSSTKCLRGHHQHSCHKSTKLSKDSCARDKTSWQAVVAGNCNPSLDACSSSEVSIQNVEIKDANDCPDEISGVSTQLRKFPSSLFPDPMPNERMGSLSVACPSDMETIFSPNFEHVNAEFKTINQNVADFAAINEKNELPLLVSAESEDGSCSSSEFQSYNELDFYNFEDLATLKFDGDMGFTDVMDTAFPDFECMSPDIMIDMMDRYMMLPFLEKTSETSIKNDDTVTEATTNSDDGCLYLAIHQMKSDHETDISYRQGYLDEMECVDQQLVFKNLPDLPEALLSFNPNWVQNETEERKPITLVLDLDETLVHSTLEHSDDADFTFQVFFNMKQNTVYVRRRPYLQIFLERVAQMFNVVIFTASQSIYAEQLLDILDPERNLISQRIYRESCIFSDGSYTKDLTILGVDLARVAIIDNSPQVFRLQVNNGIPIKSWFDDPSDGALISLLPFLETLARADDVRPLIAKRFGTEEE